MVLFGFVWFMYVVFVVCSVFIVDCDVGSGVFCCVSVSCVFVVVWVMVAGCC